MYRKDSPQLTTLCAVRGFEEQLIQEEIRSNMQRLLKCIEMVSMEKDWAVFQLEISPDSNNLYGMVHDAALYTLAGTATKAAVISVGRTYVAQEGILHFVSNQPVGLIKATARVGHCGSKICLTTVEITGDGGKLVATGEFFYYVSSDTPKEYGPK